MTSSVSVVRAWKRHVSHTSSPIFTEDNDISAAAGRLGFRAAVDWWVRGSAELGPFLGNGCVLRRVAGVACAACFTAGLGPAAHLSGVGSWGPVRLDRSKALQVGPGIWMEKSFCIRKLIAEVFSFTLKSDKLLYLSNLKTV